MTANRIALAAALTFVAAVIACGALITRSAPHEHASDADMDAMREAMLTEFDWHAAQLAELVNEAERRLDPWGIGRVQFARNRRH